MELIFIIGLVFFILAAFLVIKLLHSVIKIVMAVIGLCLILSIALGAFVFLDVKDMNERITTQPNLIVLTNEQDVLSGIYLDPNNESDQPFYVLNESQIISVENAIKENDKDPLVELNIDDFSDADFFKIVTIDVDIIKNTPNTSVNFGQFIIHSDELYDIVTSTDSKDAIIQKVESDDDLIESFKESVIDESGILDVPGIELKDVDSTEFNSIAKEQIVEIVSSSIDSFSDSDVELKGMLFASYFATILNKDLDGAKLIFESYKNETINIYPESITFSLIRLSPSGIIDGVINRVEDEGIDVPNISLDNDTKDNSQELVSE
jgi:hypothetical protein